MNAKEMNAMQLLNAKEIVKKGCEAVNALQALQSLVGFDFEYMAECQEKVSEEIHRVSEWIRKNENKPA